MPVVDEPSVIDDPPPVEVSSPVVVPPPVVVLPSVVPSPVVESPVVDSPPLVAPPVVVSSETSLAGPNFITETTDHTKREPAKVADITVMTVPDVPGLF